MNDLTPLAQMLVKQMRHFGRDGHTHAPINALMESIKNANKATDTELVMALSEAIDEGHLIKTKIDDETVIYIPSVYQMEKSVAKRLALMLSKSLQPLSQSKLQHALTNIRRTSKLSEEQQNAVQGVVTHKISVLTGGPGTGKTTTLRAILDVCDTMNITYEMAAPTGAAAKRMSHSTGRNAATIHRMLGWNPEENTFAHTPEYHLPTDMIIIDEASMLDLWLLHHLLRAVSENCRLLFVGDVNQLPSVGSGNVLKDIIGSEVVNVNNLTTIFRQSEDSVIVTNARAINMGQMPDLNNRSKDFFMFAVADQQVSDMVADIVANRIPDKFGYAPDDIQVLSAKYKGTGGVNEVNSRLQQQLTGSNWSVRLKQGLIQVGDRVIQTKNNYDHNVMNGEVGQVIFINKQDKTITINFEGNRVVYPYNKMWMVKLAYAITTHRSQGNEFPVVVIPITSNMGHMLQRNLLYTAITRAKEMIVLVGSRAAVKQAIDNNTADKRWTGLTYRIRRTIADSIRA